MTEKTVEEQKFDIGYDTGEYWDDDSYEDDDELSCDNCGMWCDHWMGDGLCELAIKEQERQAADYKRRHTGERCCPICKTKLKRYDCVGVDELWTWNPEQYDAMIAIEILGPMSLNKGEVHHKGNLYHVWIEWGTGKRECLIRLLPKEVKKKP